MKVAFHIRKCTWVIPGAMISGDTTTSSKNMNYYHHSIRSRFKQTDMQTSTHKHLSFSYTYLSEYRTAKAGSSREQGASEPQGEARGGQD